jgi:hypothetical protein
MMLLQVLVVMLLQALVLLVLVIVEAVQLIQMPMRLMSMTMLQASLQIISNWELFVLLLCYCCLLDISVRRIKRKKNS